MLETIKLTFLPSLVDRVFVHLGAFFFNAGTLVKDLGLARICIVHAQDSVTPPLADDPVSFAHELLLLLVFFQGGESVLQDVDLFSRLFRCLQGRLRCI